MMRIQHSLWFAVALSAPALAGAQDDTLAEIPVSPLSPETAAVPAPAGGRWALGLRAGSSGLGAELALGLSARFDLRAGYYGGTYSDSVNYDGIDYDADLEAQAGAVMLDFRPFAGGFRVTAGVYSAPPDIVFRHTANNDSYEIGGAEYTADGQLDGDIDLGGVTPYAGIGWGGGSGAPGFAMSLDVGVMFAQSPSISLQASGRACNSSLLACDPNGLTGFDVNDPDDARAQTFRDELEQERRNVEDDVSNYKLWPVLSLGVHYRF
jgi:hypothetical protein